MVLVKCGKIDTPSCVLRLGYIYIFTTICSNVYLLQTVTFDDFLSIPLSLSLSVSHGRKRSTGHFLFYPVYPDLIIIYFDEIATISLSTTSQPFPLPPYDDDD